MDWQVKRSCGGLTDCWSEDGRGGLSSSGCSGVSACGGQVAGHGCARRGKDGCFRLSDCVGLR
ncbi:hypothetical protein E2562_021857 [Oryza meyeriana var. granulata]|uniref:Uncharacterized protein n=1 Tax=Oryza meyeriana var. granulata TaxID=110450 RepID=A0A6G1C849_9ORYZ|nr:hypothetical protein E2562_021857 [Oryza meyeriana var. granulata]